MWIFTTEGFYSFTQSTHTPGFIQIRARDDRDLVDLKKRHGLKGRIIETTNSDYRWRVLVRPKTAQRIMAAEAERIDYSNFKNATSNRMHSRPLMDVWSAMMDVQRKRVRELHGEPAPHPWYHRDDELFSDGTIDEDEETTGHVQQGLDLDIDRCDSCLTMGAEIAYTSDGNRICTECAE